MSRGALSHNSQRSLFAAVALATLVVSLPVAAADKCVRIAVTERGGESSSIDPTVAKSEGDYFNVNALYEPIIWIDDDLAPQPLLAQSWESNAEATEWTFHLRTDVTFHDGSPFTAADVVYTYQRVLDPNSGVAAKELTFINPENITAVDEHTVKFVTAEPSVEFPTLIANKFAYISKAGVTAEELAKKSYGTGPFMSEGFVPSEPRARFVKNPRYWQAGLPKAGCVELTAISDSLVRAAAVSSGEIDIVTSVEPTILSLLEKDSNIELTRSKLGGFLTLSMFVDTPPFDDARVRKAMKLVVDREAILQTVLLGYGQVGNDNPIPLNHPDAYRTDMIARDVEQAKALLAEAGHAGGLSIDLYTAPIGPGTVELAQAYQQMAADAGIQVNVLPAPADSYWEQTWLKQPFVVSYWGARPTSSALSIAYRKGAKYNETHWASDAYDGFLDKANATIDPAERSKLYQQAQQLLAEEGGVVGPAFTTQIAAVRKPCDGYHPHSDFNRAELRNVFCP